MRSTALAALARGYRVAVLRDATAVAAYNEARHTEILERELPDAGVRVVSWREALAEPEQPTTDADASANVSNVGDVDDDDDEKQ